MRPNIGIFGKRNVGKSSLINALTGQELAIVSEFAGTTTDPVGKAMEILPLGPVFILDTAGLDDIGDLGAKRVEKTYTVLRRTDLALHVTTYNDFDQTDKDFLKREKNVIVVFNKSDLAYSETAVTNAVDYLKRQSIDYISVSAMTGSNIAQLRIMITARVPEIISSKAVITDLIKSDDIVLQVMPIDSSAPKGRIILPQEQVLREALDNHAISICIQPEEILQTLQSLKQKPRLAITDSQVIERVTDIIPDDIMLTTYSILFSRLKGNLNTFISGLEAISRLRENDRVMIAEACTHHRQSDDIGTIKIPRWLQDYTGKKLNFLVNAGKILHQDLREVKLIIHCGGCMINKKEMLSRMELANDIEIPITNYGVLIAHMHDSLRRTLQPFPESYNTYKRMVNLNSI